MSPLSAKSVFYAKIWFYYVGAIVFSLFALFCAVLGPLFLFDIIKSANGEPGRDAGIPLCIMAVPMSLVALMGWFNVYARRKPLLRICEEGMEVSVIGASSLNEVPLVPTIIRLAWAIVSLHGFKKEIGWIPWEWFRDVKVVGLPMMRRLVIDATIVYPGSRAGDSTAQIGNSVAFRDAAFQDSLESIASAILTFYDRFGAPAERADADAHEQYLMRQEDTLTSDVDQAHGHSIGHRDEVLASEVCGCFYCCEVYPPSEIAEWTDDCDGIGQTALCPRCGIDSVIGSESGYPVSREFLRQMHDHWFTAA